MKRYVCTVCGFVYDEAKGMPDAGIAPGTTWEQLPENWVCPICGAPKSVFVEAAAPAQEKKTPVVTPVDDMQMLSALEASVICSNLARGCEKQYRQADAEQFLKLAAYFKSAAPEAEAPALNAVLSLVEKDLQEGFVHANAAAKADGDRGALRALTWSEKVTRILEALLERYEREGDAMLENTGVYLCTICGFIYIGDTPPTVCPVCKVPNWKFEKVMGR